MAKQYTTVSEFSGYYNKRDLTNLRAGVLVAGSQNVVSTDGDRIAARKGYSLDGAAGTSSVGTRSSYDWNTSTGVERNLPFYDDELEYRYVASDDTVTWRRLKD